MSLTPLAWVVVHSLWQCTLIGGATALALGRLARGRASTRYAVACAGLAAMLLAPMATVMWRDLFGPRVRFELLSALDATASVPTIVAWAMAIFPVIAAGWLAAVAVSSFRLALEWRRVRWLRGGGNRDADGSIRAAVAALQQRMSVRSVDVRLSNRATVPMVLGARSPMILLPSASMGVLGAPQLRSVLAHELAHVRRRDYIVNLLQSAADVLLVHHPAARWVSNRIRIEREYCCDDAAVAVTGNAGLYARALAALEDARPESRLAVAAASGTLLDRIQRIAGEPRRVLTPMRGVAAMLAATLLTAALLAVIAVVPPVLVPGLRMRTPAPPGAVIAPPPGGVPKLPRSR